jgi:hypothetical protein
MNAFVLVTGSYDTLITQTKLLARLCDHLQYNNGIYIRFD